jgi:6-phosphogluconate dehydrogenase
MGKNIVAQLLKKGYRVVAQNRSPEPLEEAKKLGAETVASMGLAVKALKPKRIVWLMLTCGEPTNAAVKALSNMLQKGDIVIDGSNSMYKDSANNYTLLNEKGIKYLDAGCSGGPSGALNGMSIMVGGDQETFKEMEKLFRDLSVKGGYEYVGPSGSGHFVKMVHNAIEYGMMQAMAEGFELLAEGPYKDLDLQRICRLWNNGSVVRGYLMELSERAFGKDPRLSSIAPYVEDSGEGRWAVHAAVEYGVPFTAISHSLYGRFGSRSDRMFGNRVLAALRHEFGGHKIKESTG